MIDVAYSSNRYKSDWTHLKDDKGIADFEVSGNNLVTCAGCHLRKVDCAGCEESVLNFNDTYIPCRKKNPPQCPPWELKECKCIQDEKGCEWAYRTTWWLCVQFGSHVWVYLYDTRYPRSYQTWCHGVGMQCLLVACAVLKCLCLCACACVHMCIWFTSIALMMHDGIGNIKNRNVFGYWISHQISIVSLFWSWLCRIFVGWMSSICWFGSRIHAHIHGWYLPV